MGGRGRKEFSPFFRYFIVFVPIWEEGGGGRGKGRGGERVMRGGERWESGGEGR